MLYLVVILLADLLIAGVNTLLCAEAGLAVFGDFLLRAGLSTVAVIAVDGILALIIRRLFPASLFAPECPLFSVGERERRLYRALGVRVWKDKVPELGGFTSFHKDHLASPSDPEYLSRFLLESNYGVMIHLCNALFGALILLIPYAGVLSVAIPVSIVNAVLSLLPFAILRYHTPPLRRLYRRALAARSRENCDRTASAR